MSKITVAGVRQNVQALLAYSNEEKKVRLVALLTKPGCEANSTVRGTCN